MPAKLRVTRGVDDLTTIDALIAEQWDYDRNHPATPDSVHHRATEKYWWLCRVYSHSFQRPVALHRRIRRCPVCAGRQIISGFNDLATLAPLLAEEWHPSKNDFGPGVVSPRSRKKVWWKCPEGHEWEAQIEPRFSREVGCPYCTGTKPIEGKTDLQSQAPSVMQFWDWNRNRLSPKDVGAGSERKVSWLCPRGHSFQRMVGQMVKSSKCPYCENREFLKGYNDLATVAPELAQQLHPTLNQGVAADSILAGGQKKYWWRCEKGHDWLTGMNVRLLLNRGCPVCSNNEVRQGINDMQTTHPQLASEWHPTRNGDLKPTDVVAGTSRRIWWICGSDHEWKTTGNYRIIDNSGCPGCQIRGFKQTEPGILYLLKNRELRAWKVGITNQNAKQGRLGGFRKLGWEVVRTWAFEEGSVASEIERKFFSWLGREKGISQHLGKAEMGALGGASETFDLLSLDDEEVHSKLKDLIEEIQAGRAEA